MIDNVKFAILKREILENHINHTQIIDLSSKLDLFTGLIEECPLKGKYFNMDVVLSCKGAYMKGSIHKLTNLLKGGEAQNYNDLCFTDANQSLTEVIEVFKLQKQTSLTNLEFGLNIRLPKDPQEFLDYNLLMYDYGGTNKDLKYGGRGDYKEFQKTDYYIKIYNKSKQYKLKGHILRVEVKIISKRKLQKLGIYKLEDLQRKDIVLGLYTFLWGELQKLMIIDDHSNIKMSIEDRNELNLYTNPHYWKKLSRSSSNKVKNNRKVRFKALVLKYKLDTARNMLFKLISMKFLEMLECNVSDINIAA
jgi:hypothetical protein